MKFPPGSTVTKCEFAEVFHESCVKVSNYYKWISGVTYIIPT